LTDAELATRLASETGALLVELRERMLRDDSPPWHMMEAGDEIAQHFIMDTLRRERPNDSVLSEEGSDDARRLSADRVWIIDPLATVTTGRCTSHCGNAQQVRTGISRQPQSPCPHYRPR
jgi:hypothetical protein